MSENEIGNDNRIIKMTAEIVSAFVSNNTVRAAELPELIETIFASLTNAGTPTPAEEPVAELKPAISIKKSVTDDYIICLNDGKKFKSLKRHLQKAFGMTPDDYRTKWGLPRDYPMTAPGYAAKRSELAKASGLGANRRNAAQAASPALTNEAGIDAPTKRRGRPKKTA